MAQQRCNLMAPICLIFFAFSCQKVDAPADHEEQSRVPASTHAATTTQPLAAPANFNSPDRGHSLTSSPLLRWDAVVGASSYEVAIGTSAGASDVIGWTDVGLVTSVVLADLSLPNAAMLYAMVRAVSGEGTKGNAAEGSGWQNLICPSNWIKVPGNTTPRLGGNIYLHGTRTRHDGSTRILSDFCVMKYQMKLHDRAGIIAEGDVDTLGFNVDYLNNAQWQAIARNIESDPRNQYLGNFNRGHSNGTASLAASNSDAEGCFGIGSATYDGNPVAADCGGNWHPNKRTHTLSNDEVIWDLTGNVWELVIDDVGAGKQIEPNPVLSALGWVEYTHASCGSGSDLCFSSANRLTFAPADTEATSANAIGRFHGGAGAYGGAVLRGGGWNGTALYAGIFSTNLINGPLYANVGLGARCVWAP